jgi:hypothetical protein
MPYSGLAINGLVIEVQSEQAISRLADQPKQLTFSILGLVRALHPARHIDNGPRILF